MKTDNLSQKDRSEKHQKWTILLPALGIFAAALVVRSISLKFGFPLFVHPDESYLMNALRDMSTIKTLDPDTYIYPAIPSFASKFVFLNLVNKIKFGGNFGASFWRDPFFLSCCPVDDRHSGGINPRCSMVYRTKD